MSRELKFRAWNGEEMISPDYITREGIAYWKENSIPCATEQVMQYTGLKDKNGAEIYDGDIILCKDSLTVRGIIVQDLDSTGFKIQWTKKTDWNKYIHVRIEHINVIGNIYANPELL